MAAGLMMRMLAAAVIGVLAITAGVLWWFGGESEKTRGFVMPSEVDIVGGEILYEKNCASCHGDGLEGQPDWQSPGPDGRLPAPPHDETGHTWHHPDSVLFQYTKLGGREALALQGVDYDSGMPGFADVLGDREIWDILAYIQSTWSERERDAQVARTAASLSSEGN